MGKHLLVILLGATGALAMNLTMTTLEAQADGDDTTESLARQIPYEGNLELDGVGVQGSVDLLFSLRDSTDTVLWSEEYSSSSAAGQVQVYSGRFAVMLGATVSLTSAIYDAEPIYVAVSVGDGAGGWTLLDGRQEVGMSPFAMWAAQSTNLVVTSQLDVNNIQVGGTIRNSGGPVTVNDNLDVTNNLEVNGNLFDGVNGALSVNDALEVSGAISNAGTSNGGSLMLDDDVRIQGDIDSTNGAVSIDDGLAVTGNFTVDGNITATDTEVDFADAVVITESNENTNGATGVLFVRKSSTSYMVMDDNEIDTTATVLALNKNVGKPIRIARDSTSAPSMGSNNGADARGTSDSLGGVSCGSGTYGAMIVAHTQGGAGNETDSFCVCMMAGGDDRWVCFDG